MTNRQRKVYNPGIAGFCYIANRQGERWWGFWHSNHIEPWPHRNHSMTLKETVLYRSSLPDFLSSCYHCSWNQRALEEEVVVVGREGRLASSRHWAYRPTQALDMIDGPIIRALFIVLQLFITQQSLRCSDECFSQLHSTFSTLPKK